jgi:hypothetical protein
MRGDENARNITMVFGKGNEVQEEIRKLTEKPGRKCSE